MAPNQYEDVSSSFLKKIEETRQRLSIKASTAMILLVQYEWNLDALVADYSSLENLLPLLRQCPRVANAESSERLCSLCAHVFLCHKLNCGHHLCLECIRVSVSDRLTAKKMPICPVLGCGSFINYSSLPATFRREYLISVLLDFTAKGFDGRSYPKKCLDLAWKHKGKVLTLALVGVCVYKTNCWERAHPYKSALIRSVAALYLHGVNSLTSYLPWSSV